MLFYKSLCNCLIIWILQSTKKMIILCFALLDVFDNVRLFYYCQYLLTYVSSHPFACNFFYLKLVLFVYYLYLCSVEIIKKLLFLVVFNLLYKNLNVYKQS